ncbi:FliM/FliN family flagellar motor switch protein [Pseudomonas sp. 21LCFQ010]|uniref:FliM/FliN family flagellar motor switch protein n=1 Tax=Pseudomonas sp. 21LCFQ010 TaxID=2957506 RepID=UPI0020968476|nr:FliM/FliN family flagellar motor switch protein [Pseudomonas sp. 21LCFQ010]MCO8161134.1 FliM/FliN family flagellar motor switch protein [Pseudomonas sp. 21LCFQ010]
MNAHVLHLPTMSQAEACVRQRIGAGLSLAFNLESQPGRLDLHLLHGPVQDRDYAGFECASGALRLSEAQALLGLLSSCPALLPPSDSDAQEHHWYWQLYNHYLSAELQALFGALQPQPVTSQTGQLCAVLQVRCNGLQVCARLQASAPTLLGLLERGQWQPASPEADFNLPLVTALTLGQLRLTRAELAGLRRGDVLLPEQALFSPEGRGTLQLGNWRLGLAQTPDHPLCFTLTQMESHPMNAPIDHFSAGDADHPLHFEQLDEMLHDHEAAPQHDMALFDDLALNLSLRAGHLSLSLGQMRSLAVGSVLTFSGCAPGQAMLYYGERVLGHGELVNVEGRLGLQITRLEALR